MHSLVGLAAVFVGFNAHIDIDRVAATFAAEGLPSRNPKAGRAMRPMRFWMGSPISRELVGKENGLLKSAF